MLAKLSLAPNRGRIRRLLGRVAIAVLLMVASACDGKHTRTASLSASASFQVTPVTWPALRRLWIAQIETDGERTWVLTLLPTLKGHGNLFSLEPRTLAVRQLPIHVRLDRIIAGEGQLWGLPNDGKSLVLINTSTGTVQSRPLQSPCGELANPSGVVKLGRLWLSCNQRIAVYDQRGGVGKILAAPHSFHLLASTAGVWAVTPYALVGIAGDASGRTIRLRSAGEPRLWQARGNQAWAADLKTLNKTLIQVNLATAAIRRFPLDTAGRQVDGFAVTPKEIWATLTHKPLIMRFGRVNPRRPSTQVDVSNAAGTSDFQIFLTAGPSYLWVELFSNRRFKLYRVAAVR
jgi:hypothetical protein